MFDAEIVLMDINTAWKRTCKIVLGDYVGELDDFQDYPMRKIKSIYLEIKRMVLKEIVNKFEKNNPLNLNIYNLGVRKSKAERFE